MPITTSRARGRAPPASGSGCGGAASRDGCRRAVRRPAADRDSGGSAGRGLSPWRIRPSRSPPARDRTVLPDPPDASAPGRARTPAPRRRVLPVPATSRNWLDRADEQPRRVAWHEAVGVKEVLLQPEAGKAPVKIADAIAGHAMTQDDMGASGRADRVGLHEARGGSRARAWSAGAATPEPPDGATRDGELACHPVQRAARSHGRARPAGTAVRRADPRPPAAPSGSDARASR